MQRELTTNTTVEVAYVGSNITHVGIPDTQPQSVDRRPARARAPLLNTRVPNPYFGIIPRSSSLGDPTITVAQLLKPYPAYTTVSLYRNNVGTTRYQGLELSLRQRMSHGLLVHDRLHALQADRRCLVGVRRVDSDRPDRQLPRSPTASIAASSATTRPATSRTYFVSSIVWDLPMGDGPRAPGRRRARRDRQRLDGDRAGHAAVGRADGGDADDQLQRLRRFRRAAAEPGRRSDAAGRRGSHADAVVQHRRLRGRAGVHARQRVAQSGARTVVPRRRPRVDPAGAAHAGEARSSSGPRCSTCSTPPNLGAPNGVAGSAAFGTITSALDPRVVQLAVKVLF